MVDGKDQRGGYQRFSRALVAELQRVFMFIHVRTRYRFLNQGLIEEGLRCEV